MKKILMVFLISLVLTISLYTNVLGKSVITYNRDIGSLSGYIFDEERDVLEGAKILIRCGENSFECYSNESGFYHRDDIPIVFCMWNVSVFNEGYEMAYCEMPIGKNSTLNFTLITIKIVELEVEILAGLSFPTPLIRIENIGNSDANNVKLSDVLIDGNVLYNNRDFLITNVLEPNGIKIVNLNSWMIGFGTFTISVVVTCEEGEFVSDETKGLIIGLIVFIP